MQKRLLEKQPPGKTTAEIEGFRKQGQMTVIEQTMTFSRLAQLSVTGPYFATSM
jgi:hypothetical protein